MEDTTPQADVKQQDAFNAARSTRRAVEDALDAYIRAQEDWKAAQGSIRRYEQEVKNAEIAVEALIPRNVKPFTHDSYVGGTPRRYMVTFNGKYGLEMEPIARVQDVFPDTDVDGGHA